MALLLCVISLAATPSSKASSYDFYNVIDLGGFDPEDEGGINAFGHVAGSRLVVYPPVGIRYDGVSTQTACSLGEAVGLNANDAVAGNIIVKKKGQSYSHAALCSATGQQVDIGTLGGNQSKAWDINDAQQITGYALEANGAITAFRFSSGTMTPLRMPSAATVGRGINESGHVAGYGTYSSGVYHAFIYDGASVSDVGAPAGYTHSSANDINDHDAMAVTASTVNGPTRAYAYSTGIFVDLGLLPGMTHSRATGINNAGDVVGCSADSPTGSICERAFIHSDGQIRALDDLVDPAFQGTIEDAYSINDRGQIAASARMADNTHHLVMLTPRLLDMWTPEYRFRPDESFRSSGAGLATDTYSTDEPPHENQLRRRESGGSTAVASANGGGGLGDLSLDYLGGSALPNDYVDEPDWNLQGSETSAVYDYRSMLSRYPGVYDEKVYGRIMADGSGDQILQYWSYYYFNPKTFYLVGEHEADWEWVQIRINRFGIPLEASYAQHGAGETCSYGSFELDDRGKPIVWVAVGSHASYFQSGNYSIPIPGLPDGTDETADPSDFETSWPRVVHVTSPPAWIMWDGYWGASDGLAGAGVSPRSPGVQNGWDAFTWSAQTQSCRAPGQPAALPAGDRAFARSSMAGPRGIVRKAVSPPLPKATARIASKRLLLRYCFASLPKDPHRRPWRINVGIRSKRDSLPPLVTSWAIKQRCGSVTQRIGPVKAPYTVLVSVTSVRGERSKVIYIRP